MQHKLLDEILPILSAIRDDEKKLKQILAFLKEAILKVQEIEEDEIIKIPEAFEKQVNNIVQGLDAGFECFLNLDTAEFEELPNEEELRENLSDEEFDECYQPKNIHWKNVLKFEALSSAESFQIMEGFAKTLTNEKDQSYILDILGRKKPFANFNAYIHQSKYREDWFKFKSKEWEHAIRRQIFDELNP